LAAGETFRIRSQRETAPVAPPAAQVKP